MGAVTEKRSEGDFSNRRQNMSALHTSYQRPLRRYFSSFQLSRSDQEDLIQELFLRLISSFGSDLLRNPDALVFTLARNLLRDRARRARTRRLIDIEGADTTQIASLAPTPEEVLEARERLQEADAALDRLKPKVRAAFLMHRIDGASYASVAQSLGVSVSMVEKHIMSALAMIRQASSDA